MCLSQSLTTISLLLSIFSSSLLMASICEYGGQEADIRLAAMLSMSCHLLTKSMSASGHIAPLHIILMKSPAVALTTSVVCCETSWSMPSSLTVMNIVLESRLRM